MDKSSRIRFFTGLLFGIFIALISILILLPEGILGIRFLLFLGTGSIISGFIAGNDIKDGARTGFLCGVIQVIILIAYGLISNFSLYSSSTLLQFIGGVLDGIFTVSIFTVPGGAISGLISGALRSLLFKNFSTYRKV